MLTNMIYLLSLLYLTNIATAAPYALAANTSIIALSTRPDAKMAAKNCRWEAKDCDLVPETWIAKFRHCSGPPQSLEGDKYGCGGKCTDLARPCPNDGQACEINAPHTECLETDGQLLFQVCGKVRGVGSTCRPSTDFRPGWFDDGLGGGKVWIYNTLHTDVLYVMRPISWEPQAPPPGFDMDKDFGPPH
jgi:hypothetical protein